jgi:aspartate kinase
VGLAAEELQIWKEVDGIFTADPRKVPTARLLSSITPEEAAELTFFGSEVTKVTIMWLIVGCASFCV